MTNVLLIGDLAYDQQTVIDIGRLDATICMIRSLESILLCRLFNLSAVPRQTNMETALWSVVHVLAASYYFLKLISQNVSILLEVSFKRYTLNSVISFNYLPAGMLNDWKIFC